MGFKINNNDQQWWTAKGWTDWKSATRYGSSAEAERAYARAEAQGAQPVGIHPTAAGEPPWSRYKRTRAA